MLQMSQIEKPRCSATIDQMRLRWAMNLPVDFQNVSSSGFHSEIQLGLRLLIRVFLSGGARPREPKTTNAVPRRSKAFLPGRRRCLFSARQDARRQQRRRRRLRFTSSVPTGGPGTKCQQNQSDKSSRRIPAARAEGHICPPESTMQKLCAVQNPTTGRRLEVRSLTHFNSSAAVTTDCATSAIFLLSFIAVLRSRA